MHLGCRAFSSLEGKTMMAKDDEVDDNDLGQRDGFSRSDIERLKAAYVSITGTPKSRKLFLIKRHPEEALALIPTLSTNN